jgi:methyltransferase (TIGR00027 family)
MEAKPPSRTARGAAVHRAVHQTLENGAIFKDPLAFAVLDDEGKADVEVRAADPTTRPLRLFIVARSRFTEESLAVAVARGVRQMVVLGAGLDTFALRNSHADVGLRVFEVDRPETQAWRRQRLAEAGLAAPESLTFVPLDFERDDLAAGLAGAGFQSSEHAFFMWLGVVPYLTRSAIDETLRFVARVPDSEVTFDYAEPVENYPPERRARVEDLGTRVAAIGEPWLSMFDAETLARAACARLRGDRRPRPERAGNSVLSCSGDGGDGRSRTARPSRTTGTAPDGGYFCGELGPQPRFTIKMPRTIEIAVAI